MKKESKLKILKTFKCRGL